MWEKLFYENVKAQTIVYWIYWVYHVIWCYAWFKVIKIFKIKLIYKIEHPLHSASLIQRTALIALSNQTQAHRYELSGYVWGEVIENRRHMELGKGVKLAYRGVWEIFEGKNNKFVRAFHVLRKSIIHFTLQLLHSYPLTLIIAYRLNAFDMKKFYKLFMHIKLVFK